MVPESSSPGAQPGPASSSEAPPLKPEVGELVPQAHGGSLRYGNPDNAGGGRYPVAVRQEIGNMVRAHGLPFLLEVLRGTATDEKAVVVSDGKDNGSHVEMVEVRIDARTRLAGVLGAVAASEGMVSPEKAGLTKRRVLEVVVRHE